MVQTAALAGGLMLKDTVYRVQGTSLLGYSWFLLESQSLTASTICIRAILQSYHITASEWKGLIN